jgi:hypothetical protein
MMLFHARCLVFDGWSIWLPLVCWVRWSEVLVLIQSSAGIFDEKSLQHRGKEKVPDNTVLILSADFVAASLTGDIRWLYGSFIRSFFNMFLPASWTSVF